MDLIARWLCLLGLLVASGPPAARSANPPQLPKSDEICIGYPPRGGWKMDGCVCVMPGDKCGQKHVDSPFHSTVHCTQGACAGSVCTIRCLDDYKMKGCTPPCTRKCGEDGQWSSTHPKCAPMIPGKAAGLNVTAINSTSVFLRWYNISTGAGVGQSRSWMVYKEETVKHRHYPPDEASHACWTRPCKYISHGLKANTTYIFYVQADNHAGIGPKSEMVQVKTPPYRPPVIYRASSEL